MATVRDIIKYVEQATGHPLNPDEGMHAGQSDRSVESATVSWMATASQLAAAGRRGDSLFIGHESLYYPYDVVNMSDPPPDWRSWVVNRQRTEILSQYDLAFLRLHGSVDELCILDDFASQLKLSEPVYRHGWVRIYEIPACPLEELIERVKSCVGLERLRVARPEGQQRPIRRIGLTWGGMGLFVNVAFQQELLEQGCDLFIAGEADSYAFRFATEAGVVVIETSHEVSEQAGLRRFTEMLQAAFADVRFTFEEMPTSWEIC